MMTDEELGKFVREFHSDYITWKPNQLRWKRTDGKEGVLELSQDTIRDIVNTAAALPDAISVHCTEVIILLRLVQ